MKNGQSRETGNIWYTRHRTKTNKTEGQSVLNGQSRETGNIWYTRHWTKTNKTEGQSRMDNPECLSSSTFVYWTKTNKTAIKNGQSRERQHLVHKTGGSLMAMMDNPEKVATFGTQDTGRRQTKLRGNQEWTIQRN